MPPISGKSSFNDLVEEYSKSLHCCLVFACSLKLCYDVTEIFCIENYQPAFYVCETHVLPAFLFGLGVS